MTTDDVQPVIDASEEVVDEEALALSKEARKRRMRKTAIEWTTVLGVALIAAYVIRTFVFQTFYIPSVSMVPTLQVGDRIVVSKISTELGAINRGDVIVFHRPPAEHCGDNSVTDLVKRVIGLPGDRVSNVGNQIFINGKRLHEHWNVAEPLGRDIGTVVVPKGQYFMMGDNRSASCDSRYWGTLKRKYVVGKVIFRIWPFSHLGHP